MCGQGGKHVKGEGLFGGFSSRSKINIQKSVFGCCFSAKQSWSFREYASTGCARKKKEEKQKKVKLNFLIQVQVEQFKGSDSELEDNALSNVFTFSWQNVD